MTTDLVTVSPETSLLQCHRLLVTEEILGAPVVDELDGTLVGVISGFDLIRAVNTEHEAPRTDPIYFREELTYSSPDWLRLPEDFQDRLAELTVADAMSPIPIMTSPDAPISEVARIMLEHRIHRVLVAENDELLGIITTFDLLPLIARPGAEAGASP